MKPALVTVLVLVVLGLLARCQPTMSASSLAVDTPSPVPSLSPDPAGAATATPGPLPTLLPSPTFVASANVLPAPSATPAAWRSYTTELGFSFACPADWRVDLPGARDGTSGSLILRLYAPAGQYTGGNLFSLSQRTISLL